MEWYEIPSLLLQSATLKPFKSSESMPASVCVCARKHSFSEMATRPARMLYGVWWKEIEDQDWEQSIRTLCYKCVLGACSHSTVLPHPTRDEEKQKKGRRLSWNKSRHFPPPKTPVLITRYDEVSCKRKGYAAFT